MYVPGAPERISPSVARTGARRENSGLSVPSRAPDPYGAQSAIPAATTTVARMVKARPIAEGDLRYSIGTAGNGGGEGSCGGRGGERNCDRADVRLRSPGRRLYHDVTRTYAQCSNMLTNAGAVTCSRRSQKPTNSLLVHNAFAPGDAQLPSPRRRARTRCGATRGSLPKSGDRSTPTVRGTAGGSRRAPRDRTRAAHRRGQPCRSASMRRAANLTAADSRSLDS